jgi:hypothetical protein
MSEGVGLKTLYAGRAMTMWDTREEAEASWRVHSRYDLIERSPTVWWRATRVVMVEPPTDVSIQDVLKKDL